jgi:hypothetical protein
MLLVLFLLRFLLLFLPLFFLDIFCLLLSTSFGVNLFTIGLIVFIRLSCRLLFHIEISQLFNQLASLANALADGPNKACANVDKMICLLR